MNIQKLRREIEGQPPHPGVVINQGKRFKFWGSSFYIPEERIFIYPFDGEGTSLKSETIKAIDPSSLEAAKEITREKLMRLVEKVEAFMKELDI